MSFQCRCNICYEFHKCIQCHSCLLWCCVYCINNDYMIRDIVGTCKIYLWTCSQKCILNTIINTPHWFRSPYVQNEIVKIDYIIKYVNRDIRQTKKYLMNYICKDVTNIIIEYSYTIPAHHELDKETMDLLLTITAF